MFHGQNCAGFRVKRAPRIRPCTIALHHAQSIKRNKRKTLEAAWTLALSTTANSTTNTTRITRTTLKAAPDKALSTSSRHHASQHDTHQMHDTAQSRTGKGSQASPDDAQQRNKHHAHRCRTWRKHRHSKAYSTMRNTITQQHEGSFTPQQNATTRATTGSQHHAK